MKIRCPKCGSTNVQPTCSGNKFSVGKAAGGSIVGGLLFGAPGMMIGAATGFNGKHSTTFYCSDCGKVFTRNI